MFRFFRRSSSATLIDLLHGEIMARSRQPEFYRDLGVADTIDGRFEMVTLHAAIAVRLLGRSPPPGPEVARDLTDSLFHHFEIALRESGVSDIAVPKRMKKLAQSYLGRAQAYAAALDGPDPDLLGAALARNVFLVESPNDAPAARKLARYVRALDECVNRAGMSALLDNDVDWPRAGDYV